MGLREDWASARAPKETVRNSRFSASTSSGLSDATPDETESASDVRGSSLLGLEEADLAMASSEGGEDSLGLGLGMMRILLFELPMFRKECSWSASARVSCGRFISEIAEDFPTLMDPSKLNFYILKDFLILRWNQAACEI